ncbi:MAG TPA: metallophosphoesterase [Sphingomicrobium sp.]|nr:metallophosphoesterase [Sphingomicrobium sp.]
MKIAAIGDLHVTEDSVAPYRQIFEEASGEADALILCGDLTNFGKAPEAEILAEDISHCSVPVLGVLGNHDYECGNHEEVARILHSAGMVVLDEQAHEIDGVGFAGVKGFLGGFGRGELAPFGEPEIKAFVDVANNEARKLENALRSLRTEKIVAVLHYSPIAETLVGEPIEIFQYLGSARLADALDRFDNIAFVVHGHAHHGTFEGATLRGTPVYNVARPVLRDQLGKAFAVLEL